VPPEVEERLERNEAGQVRDRYQLRGGMLDGPAQSYDDEGRVVSMRAYWEPDRTMASFRKG